ncbi:head GIN domain-containing protein [Calditrichota bacterium]
MYLTTQVKSAIFNKVNLKRIFNLIFVLVLVISVGCSEKECPLSPISDGNSIKGSGNLISESMDFSSFNYIHIATAGTVNLTQGSTQEVQYTVDDNLQEHIRMSVSNGILMISLEIGISVREMHLTVDVQLPQINELHTSSAGNFIGQNTFNCDEVRLFSSSAGNIYLNLNADYLFTHLSSAGNANLSGTVNTHDAIISSAGCLAAFGLNTDTTHAVLSSAGNAEVAVNNYLNATLSSAGSLYYKGNPMINSSVSSLGRIINAN